MFCTTCGTFVPLSKTRCPSCATTMGSRAASIGSRAPRSATALRWSMALLPVLVLVICAGLGVQRWRAHEAEKATVYRQAEVALAAGDFEAAELSFTALGGYRDSVDRLTDVQSIAEPVRSALDEAVDTFDAGDYATAIALLEAIVAEAPGFTLAHDLLESSQAAHIEQLTRQAISAEANRDWWTAELAMRELTRLVPDDPVLDEQLSELTRMHAPLAFARDGAIFIAGPDGEDERALTPSMGAIFPSWSPDRRHIAFIATVEGADRFRGRLMLMNGDGSELRAVADDVLPYSWPVWSPDARGIAYTSLQGFDTDTFTGSISLNVYEVETGIERDLTGEQLPHAAIPTWSPDGEHIAFVSNRLQRRNEGGISLEDGDVYMVPAAGGTVRDLTRNRIFDESWVQWSPGGDRLIIFTAPGNWSMPAKSELYLLDFASEELTEIEIDEWQTSLPFWSPDGTRIAYITGGDTLNIWSDQGLHWVQLGSDVSSFVCWSPDGRYVLVPSVNHSMPSFVIDAVDQVGAMHEFELDYDDLRSGNGPPVWGSFTPAVEPEG